MADIIGYTGKRAVVTGCASGIGRAAAALLLELGADVHGLDHQACDLKLGSFTGVDLGDPDSIDSAVANLDGPVDALFNCAGLAPTRKPMEILKVNFLGTRYLTEQVLPRMRAGGAIVSTSSNGGLGWRKHLPEINDLLTQTGFDDGIRWFEQHGEKFSNAYSFCKEALIVWTMQQSAILIKRDIRINCTSPGTVQTPMLDEIEMVVPQAAIDAVAEPIGRRSAPHEQAWPLVLLNSPVSGYINGVDLAVDGGFAAMLNMRA